MSELEEWLRSLIQEFRTQYNTLPESTRKYVSNLDNFNPPCQVLALWVAEPEEQYLFVTRDSNRPDLEIKAVGPLPLSRVLESMETILEEPWLQKPLDKSDHFLAGSYRDLLEDIFIGLVNRLRYEVLVPTRNTKETHVGPKMIYAKGGFYWDISGNLTQLDVKKVVEEIIAQAPKQEQFARTQREAPTQTQPVQAEIVKGHGTFFYPPVWVGKLPEVSFRQHLFGMQLFPLVEGFTASYKGRVVRIMQDGYVALGEPDKAKCVRFLNEIMGTSLLSGLPVFAIRENDIGEVSFRKDSKMIEQIAFPVSPDRARLASYQFSIDEQSLRSHREVAQDSLLQIIQKAEQVTRQPAASDYLVFLLEAYTLFTNSEYMQSFIMSWLVLERYITKLWEGYLAEEGVSGERKRKLTNPLFWSTDYVLETLNLSGKINDDEFKSLMRLKTKRNDITHEGSITAKNESEECLRTAELFVRRELGLTS